MNTYKNICLTKNRSQLALIFMPENRRKENFMSIEKTKFGDQVFDLVAAGVNLGESGNRYGRRWQIINRHKYRFNSDGYALTGLQKIAGSRAKKIMRCTFYERCTKSFPWV